MRGTARKEPAWQRRSEPASVGVCADEGAVLAAETARNADFGKPVLVYPNLYLVRVPLPHNPLRALNSYFILDDDGTTNHRGRGFQPP